MSEKIAVIGGGISGLSAAWHLSKYSNVTLYEKNSYYGGHAHTISLKDTNEVNVSVDVGFMVFNKASYPNLIKFFDLLNIERHQSDMSFSMSDEVSNYEYSGSGLKGYFGQKSNVYNKKHWQQLIAIIKFYSNAEQSIKKYSKSISLNDFLKAENYPTFFTNNHIIPMCSAIWSCDPKKMLEYPAHDFVNFFINHGLFKLSNRPKWSSVAGGSKKYVDAIIEASIFKKRNNVNRLKIEKKGKKYKITDNDSKSIDFDKIVLATQAPESKVLIESCDKELAKLLDKFKYQQNIGYLHSDPNQMPRNKKLWSSWNYTRKIKTNNMNLSMTYWLNNIQKLNTQSDFFLTLNPEKKIPEKNIIEEIIFTHPIFDLSNKEVKKRVMERQGKNNIWVCGSFLGYGFHEDGIQSGLLAAESITKQERPWTTDKAWNRIAV